MEPEIPTKIMLLVYLVLIIGFIAILSFVYYGWFKIYKNYYTFNYFVKFIFSYLLIFSVDLIYRQPSSLESILEITLGYFSVLSALVILFFLFRIEDRGYDYKYAMGFLISLIIFLISTTLYTSCNSQISFFLSLYGSIYLASALLFFPYLVKIVSKIAKTEKIRYPTFFLIILGSFLLIDAFVSSIHHALEWLPLLIIIISAVSIIPYIDRVNNWLNSDSNENDVTKTTPENYFFYKFYKYQNKLLNKGIRIELSQYQLRDKVYDSILNGKDLDLKNYSEKELQFMQVCANQLVNEINQDLSSIHTNILTGVGLIILPLFRLYSSFSLYWLNFPILTPSLSSNFESIIISKTINFDILTRLGTIIVMTYIFATLYALILSLGNSNSKTKMWIRNHKVANIVYGAIPIIVCIIMVAMWLQTNEISKNMIEDFILLSTGMSLYYSGGFWREYKKIRLNKAYKLILAINHEMLFSEDKRLDNI